MVRSSPPLGVERNPGRYRWIVDGHNAIFAVPAWESLQLSGRRREARLALEERLEEFGRAIGGQVWVAYDGNTLDRNPDRVDRPHLLTCYAQPPEEADDRIRFLVRGALDRRERPVVVTSDRRTLGATLPEGAQWLEVGSFFDQIVKRALRLPEKWEPLDLADIERHFLGCSDEPAGRDLASDDESDP